MSVGDVAALVGAAAALATAGVALRDSRRAARASADAEERAERAERRAERADERGDEFLAVTNRIADAAEQRIAVAKSGKPSTPMGVAWAIERVSDMKFALRNVGDVPADAVTAVAAPKVIARNLPTGVTVEPLRAVQFDLVKSWGGPLPDAIQVTWRGHPDPVTVPVPLDR